MDEELRRRERAAQGNGDPDSEARLQAATRRSRGPLPRWNPFTRVRCQLAFSCPNAWEAMTPTAQLGVRRCDHCEADVHEVRSAQEFELHAQAGRCVSVAPEAAFAVTVDGRVEPGPLPPLPLQGERLTGPPLPPVVPRAGAPPALKLGLALALLAGAGLLAWLGWG